MPLNPIDFSRHNYQADYSGLGDLFSNYFKGHELARTPKKLEQEELARQLQNQMFGEQITGQQQQNQYNPRIWEENLANSIAHRGLYGAQAKEHEINALKQQQILDFIKQATGGQQSMQEQMPGQQFGQMQGQEMQPGGQQQQMETQQPGMQQQQRGNNNYLPNAVAAHALGIPQHHPHITPNGEIVTFDPLTGQPQIVSAGLMSPAEASELSESGKLTAQEKNDLLNTVQASYDKEPMFQELMRIVNTPEFYEGTGALMSRISRLSDDPQINAMVGETDSLLGTLINKTATGQFGARLNQSEYKGMQRIKGSTSDNPHNLAAKIKLMYALDKYDRQIKEKYYRNLDKKMNKLDALQNAHKSVDYSEIRNVIKVEDLAHKAASATKSDYGRVMQAAQRFSKDKGISIEEALKLIGGNNGKR